MKKYILYGAIAGAIAVILMFATTVFATNNNNITLCHRTASQQNPYTKITVDKNSANGFPSNNNSDHGNHNGSVFPAANWGDIIPPFEQDILPDYPGKNWTAEGQAILRNDCNIPQPTPTPSPTPDPEYCEDELALNYGKELPCEYEEEEPTPTETPKQPVCTENCGNPPTFAGSSTEAPVCSSGETTNVVANPYVLRSGSEATINFFITEGDSANIFYKEVSASDWQHAISDVKPNSDKFVSVVIGGLDPKLGYTFGIEQKFGCSGGKRTAVIVDDPTPILFRLSYYE